MGQELRVGIAGTGFIGSVHARSARLAGGRLVGVAASTHERAVEAAGALGAERAFASAEELVAADDIDVVHICTPNHLHAPLAARGARRRQARRLREAARARRRRGGRAGRRGRLRRPRRAPSPSPTASTPSSARRASASPSGASGDVHLVHGSYLQDWLLRPEDDNWRVEREPRRRVARLRRHRLALVRPRRVRLRPAHRPRLRPALATVVAERARGEGRQAFAGGNGGGESRARRHRGRRGRPVRDRGRGARLDGDQPGLRRAQEPPVARGRLRRRGARLRPGAARDAVDRPPRGDDDHPPRPRAPLGAGAAASRRSPPATPRATRSASTASSRTSTRPSAPASTPDGLPRFADGLRADADHRRGARLRAQRAVGRRRRRRPRGGVVVKLGFLTACMPERPLEEIATWAARQRLRDARARGLARARRPPVHGRATSPPTASTPPSRSASARRSTATGSSCRRSPTTTTTSIPTRASARPTTRTCARASTPPPRWAACPSAPSSAATPVAASPTTSARPSASSRRSSTTRASAA